MILKAFTCFLIVSCRNIYVNSAVSKECKICQPRNFSANLIQDCLCVEAKFCNVLNGKCNDCGDCFRIWNSTINNTKGNVGSLLEKLIKNLQRLQDQVELIIEKLPKQAHELISIKNISKLLESNFGKVSNKTSGLENDLKEIERQLEAINFPTGDDKAILNYLRKLKKEINELAGKLKNFKIDVIDKNNFTRMLNELKNINSNVLDMENQFPKIEPNFLNLAQEVENDLDLLESIIANANLNANNTFPGSIINSMSFIEKALLNLFDILNNFQILPFSINELEKNASDVRLLAETTKSKLEDLLKQQEDFENLFKKIKFELQAYYDIKNLKERFDAIIKEINILNQLANSSQQYDKLNEKFDEYKEELERFNNKIKELESRRLKMDELLNEKKQILETDIEFEPIDQLESEIEDMIKEVKKIIIQLESHCTSKS